VFNILGEEIAVLINKELPAGAHTIRLNAENLSSRIYFYHIKTAGFIETRKLVLIK